MPRLLAFGLLCAAILTLSPRTFAGNDPPPASNVLYGFYFSNVTLTAASPGPVYYVIGDVFIQPGVTLTIEPGVTVMFAANHDTLNGGDYFYDSEILCEGNLIAVGTQSDSISFTSSSSTPQKGDWGQIKFLGTGQGVLQYLSVVYANNGISSSSSGAVSLSHSKIRGISGNGVNATAGQVNISDVVIRDVNGHGISANSSTISVSRSLITQSSIWGVASVAGSGTVENTRIENCGGGILGSQGSQLAVRWNHIESVVGMGIQLSGSAVSPRVVLSDTVWNTGGFGIQLWNCTADTLRLCDVRGTNNNAIDLPGSYSVVLTNCLVRPIGHGISWNGDYVRILYCTIVGGGAGEGLSNYGAFATIKNNIIVQNAIGIRNGGGDPEIRFNDVWNNGTNYLGTACDGNCISINPLFVNAAAGDYHLLSNSPCKVLGEGGTQMGRYGPEQGTVSGVGDNVAELSPAYLLPNAPNPFSRSTDLTVMAKEGMPAVLEVFSLSGQLLKRENGIVLQPGANTIHFNRAELGAGVYFYRVSGDRFVQTRRFVVVD